MDDKSQGRQCILSHPYISAENGQHLYYIKNSPGYSRGLTQPFTPASIKEARLSRPASSVNGQEINRPRRPQQTRSQMGTV